MNRDGISRDIKGRYGQIGDPTPQGWTKQVNEISWNGGEAKIDIRDWSPDGERCGKGITLTHREAEDLLEILKKVI